MVSIGKPLVTSHYTGTEFKSNTILNNGTTVEDLSKKILKSFKKNGDRRRKSQARARKSTRF